MRILLELVRAPLLFLWWGWRGWGVENTLPDDPKLILLGVPHTSNWDYIHFLAGALHQRRRPYVTVKHTLFVGPMGWFIRLAGGIPIDRHARHNVVEQLAHKIDAAQQIIVLFTPEGTRSYTPYWKTGFYYTALQADVPIAPVAIDYKHKRVRFGPKFHPSGDIEADFEILKAYYEAHGRNGLRPENVSDLALRPRRATSDTSATPDEERA